MQDDKIHKRTIQHRKNKPKVSQKDHLRYWDQVIFQRRPGGNWCVQIGYAGRQQKVSLGTPVKSAAAARARQFYLTLISKGWSEALAELKPDYVPASGDASTIGDLVEELEATADPKLLRGYATAFRKIVADAFGIDGGKEKFDYRNGGRDRWIERVHAINLRDVTPAVVQKWKRDFLARAEDPIRLRSAKISANSILRCAKTLFSPKLAKYLSRVQLPSPLPFEGLKIETRKSPRYSSKINVEELTRDAQAELALSDPPAFLTFILALGAGLRRLEIDRLEWSAFLWAENAIRIEPTQYFDVKTEHSIGNVSLDPETMAIMRGYHAKARSNFVIESPNLPRKGATGQNYRAHKAEKRLIKWLRSKGVSSQKPIHELRKEFGSMVNRKHGLSAAKDQLRHGDIAITHAHYIDVARQATSGLGSLLKAADEGKIVPLEEQARSGIERQNVEVCESWRGDRDAQF